MKQGDTITTKDGIQLITVPYVSDCAPCSGCFFFKDNIGCVKRSELENRNVACWDKDGNHLIFTIKDDQAMKTINNLTITVTYTVGIGNIKVPKEVYDDLIKHYDNESREVPENSIAAEWLADNIKEKDAMDWSCKIDDLKMEKCKTAKYEEGVPFVIETPEGKKLKIMFEETGMMDCKGCAFASLGMECWGIPCVSPERKDGLIGRFVEVKE